MSGDKLSLSTEKYGNLSTDSFNKVHIIKLSAAGTNASQSNHLLRKVCLLSNPFYGLLDSLFSHNSFCSKNNKERGGYKKINCIENITKKVGRVIFKS